MKHMVIFNKNRILFFSVIGLVGLLLIIGCSEKVKNNDIESGIKVTESNWEPISRARYTQGTIEFLGKTSDFYTLTLKVERKYHSEADPIDNPNLPFQKDEVVQIVLKEAPKIELAENTRVIILGSQVTSGKKTFYGGDILYFEKSKKYYDMNGEEAVLPFEMGE